jgi:hypothetical protein
VDSAPYNVLDSLALRPDRSARKSSRGLATGDIRGQVVASCPAGICLARWIVLAHVRAVGLTEFGEPDVLHVLELPQPKRPR